MDNVANADLTTTATDAERTANPDAAKPVEGTPKPTANTADLARAAEQVRQRASGEQAAVKGYREPVLTQDRKTSKPQSVQTAMKKAASKVDANTDDSSLPTQTNRERTTESHLERHVTNQSGATRVDSVALESGPHKNANAERSVGLTRAAVITCGDVPGSARSHEPPVPSGTVTSRPVEAEWRLPESFVPGASQMLSRLSHQEMRFGWDTPDFGRVEIRAMVDHDRVGAVVSADARLCDSLHADLASLSRSLANQSLELAHFQTSSSGSDGGAGRGQDTGGRSERDASSDGESWRPLEIRKSVLSIHQGALDLRA
ncbi:MAG: hypothetical protein ROO76_01635 [Terriglobia bacterium]|nr:hypothetical protein [Terriglobia bacterium]